MAIQRYNVYTTYQHYYIYTSILLSITPYSLFFVQLYRSSLMHPHSTHFINCRTTTSSPYVLHIINSSLYSYFLSLFIIYYYTLLLDRAIISISLLLTSYYFITYYSLHNPALLFLLYY